MLYEVITVRASARPGRWKASAVLSELDSAHFALGLRPWQAGRPREGPPVHCSILSSPVSVGAQRVPFPFSDLHLLAADPSTRKTSKRLAGMTAVITSYSIHYTKLYDHADDGDAAGPEGVEDQLDGNRLDGRAAQAPEPVGQLRLERLDVDRHRGHGVHDRDRIRSALLGRLA